MEVGVARAVKTDLGRLPEGASHGLRKVVREATLTVSDFAAQLVASKGQCTPIGTPST